MSLQDNFKSISHAWLISLSPFCFPLDPHSYSKKQSFFLFLQKKLPFICKYHFFFVTLQANVDSSN